MGQGSRDSSPLTKLVISATRELIDVREETEFFVQNNPMVSDRVTKGDMRENFSHKIMVDTHQLPSTAEPYELSF